MPPDDERGDGPDGTVLTPEELEITGGRNVSQLDDDRYLITPSNVQPDDRPTEEDDSPLADGSTDESAGEGQIEPNEVDSTIRRRLDEADTRYGYGITATFEGRVVRDGLLSNDVLTVFENLLVWFAQHVDGDAPIEDVIGALIAESTIPISLPPETVEDLARDCDLEADDSLSTLFEALERDGGLRLEGDDV